MENIKLLTYNTYIRPPGITARGNDFKRERLNELSQRIDEFDIITFQELFGSLSSKRKEFLKKINFAHVYIKKDCFLMNGHLIDGGLCILSKHPIIKTGQWLYHSSTSYDSLSAKGVLFARIQIDNPDNHNDSVFINVFTTHFQADYAGNTVKTARVRERQIGELITFIKQTITENPGYSLLCGDLNIPFHENLQYQSFIQRFQNEGLMLIDYDQLHLPTYGKTNEHGELLDTIITSTNPHPINECLDYIFEIKLNDSDDSQLTHSAIQVQSFPSNDNRFPFLSDHYGLSINLNFRREPQIITIEEDEEEIKQTKVTNTTNTTTIITDIEMETIPNQEIKGETINEDSMKVHCPISQHLQNINSESNSTPITDDFPSTKNSSDPITTSSPDSN